MLHFRFGNEAFLCCRASNNKFICILLNKDALVSKIIITFAVAFFLQKAQRAERVGVLLWNRAFAYAHLRNRKLRNFTSC